MTFLVGVTLYYSQLVWEVSLGLLSLGDLVCVSPTGTVRVGVGGHGGHDPPR